MAQSAIFGMAKGEGRSSNCCRSAGQAATGSGSSLQRFGFLLRMAGLPALAAIPIIIPFRVPRELIEVLAPPVLVPLIGYGWMQLAAFRSGAMKGRGEPPARLMPLAFAAIALLAFFQLVLKRGITF